MRKPKISSSRKPSPAVEGFNATRPIVGYSTITSWLEILTAVLLRCSLWCCMNVFTQEFTVGHVLYIVEEWLIWILSAYACRYDFARVHVPAGKSVRVTLNATALDFTQVDENGHRRIVPGEYSFQYGIPETGAENPSETTRAQCMESEFFFSDGFVWGSAGLGQGFAEQRVLASIAR